MGRRKSKKVHEKEELWSRKFDDEEDVNKNYSRTERKKAANSVSPVMTSLVIFLALFIILPTSVYLWYSSNTSKADQSLDPDDSIVITQNESSSASSESISSAASDISSQASSEESKEESSVASEETKVAEKAEDTQKAKNKENTQTEPKKETKKVTQEEPKKETTETTSKSEKKQPETTEKTKKEEQSGSTYTVKAGDNLYRIALNHNMTTDELKALNGLSSDNVSVGTVLTVK
ncbi:LysM peptidoglycan-binding domain-containing protein [Pisciglobus halotolerans]|uniref:LysM repeat-containing protein n=1 Tax=Pisciglobus halotolerans TaxID=745365 RepID=A0A1I3CHT2_9LACT|nr:LysM peptidoglycan-binding domain-containing protein [Pisciglobus halotolerans]SFH73789.1 LysM repeat-containing protein [Pisciglobus halotolerans]